MNSALPLAYAAHHVHSGQSAYRPMQRAPQRLVQRRRRRRLPALLPRRPSGARFAFLGRSPATGR